MNTTKEAEITICYAQAYDHLCEAIKWMDKAGKKQGLIGVGLITHAGKASEAEKELFGTLIKWLQLCKGDDLVSARIKIVGK